LCITAKWAADVGDGSNSTEATCSRRVRFTPQHRALLNAVGVRRNKAFATNLVPRLENHVNRRFRGATNLCEPAGLDDLGQFRLSGLGAERHANFLR
jgi:hypothetical protein